MFSYKRNHALIKDLIKARFNQIVFTSQINQRFSKIFWRRRLPLQQFCFSLRWKIMSRPLLWLHIYRLKDINDNPMVYMVTKERRGSAEAVVIYFASITYHLQKALPINRYFVLRSMGRSAAWQDKTAAWGSIPYAPAHYCVVTKDASPQRS